MNPRVKTTLLGIVGLAVIVADRLLPQSAPMWVQAIALLLAAAIFIAGLLHAPGTVLDVLSTLLAAVTQPPPANSLDDSHPAVVRARRILKRGHSLLPVGVVVLLVVVAPIGAGTETGCTPPPSTPNVINSGATCADDIVQDVQQPPTQALLAQTLIDCGLTALALYQAIQELIAQASGDAGADGGALVSTRRRGAVPRELYLAHLHKWSDLAAAACDGGAR